MMVNEADQRYSKSKEIISESEDESDGEGEGGGEASVPPTQDPSTNGNSPAPASAPASGALGPAGGGEPTTAGTSVLSDDNDNDAVAETELGVEAVPTAAGVAGVEADDGAMDQEMNHKSSMDLGL